MYVLHLCSVYICAHMIQCQFLLVFSLFFFNSGCWVACLAASGGSSRIPFRRIFTLFDWLSTIKSLGTWKLEKPVVTIGHITLTRPQHWLLVVKTPFCFRFNLALFEVGWFRWVSKKQFPFQKSLTQHMCWIYPQEVKFLVYLVSLVGPLIISCKLAAYCRPAGCFGSGSQRMRRAWGCSFATTPIFEFSFSHHQNFSHHDSPSMIHITVGYFRSLVFLVFWIMIHIKTSRATWPISPTMPHHVELSVSSWPAQVIVVDWKHLCADPTGCHEWRCLGHIHNEYIHYMYVYIYIYIYIVNICIHNHIWNQYALKYN